MWLKRILGLMLLCALAIFSGHQYGYLSLPTLDTQTAIILAATVLVIFTIVLRLLAIAAMLSFLTGLLLLAAIVVASQFFFLEREQERFYANEANILQATDTSSNRHSYLEAMGIKPSDNIITDSFNHGYNQAENALQSQKLRANEVGIPLPKLSSMDVWQEWLYQLIMLACGVILSVFVGRKKSAPAKQSKKPS